MKTQTAIEFNTKWFIFLWTNQNLPRVLKMAYLEVIKIRLKNENKIWKMIQSNVGGSG